MNILHHLTGSDILKCRLLNSTWSENCSSHLRRNSKVVLKLHSNNIHLFVKAIEEDEFGDFIMVDNAVLLEMSEVDIDEQIYIKFFKLHKSLRIKDLNYIVRRGAGNVQNLVSLLQSSCYFYENLEFLVPPLANSDVEILQQSLRTVTFLKLKRVRINDNYSDMPSIISEFFSNVITSAPKLEYADIPDCNIICRRISMNTTFTLKTLSLWFNQRMVGSMDRESLVSMFNQLALSLEELYFQPISEDQVSALDSVSFRKVNYLRLSSNNVFVYASRICPRNFPALKKFHPLYCCFGDGPPQLAENEIPIFHPHDGVQEIQTEVLGAKDFYNIPMGKSIRLLLSQFPLAVKYSIQEDGFASLLCRICSTNNAHIKELCLYFNSGHRFPQEFFIGVHADLLHGYDPGTIVENSNSGMVPSIGDIPNLEALEIYRGSGIPYYVVTFGLIRIKNLKKLRLPQVPNLCLRFIADNFSNLESLTLEEIPGERFSVSDVEYIKAKLPGLALHINSSYTWFTQEIQYN